jgi:hypothetical protein
MQKRRTAFTKKTPLDNFDYFTTGAGLYQDEIPLFAEEGRRSAGRPFGRAPGLGGCLQKVHSSVMISPYS